MGRPPLQPGGLRPGAGESGPEATQITFARSALSQTSSVARCPDSRAKMASASRRRRGQPPEERGSVENRNTLDLRQAEQVASALTRQSASPARAHLRNLSSAGSRLRWMAVVGVTSWPRRLRSNSSARASIAVKRSFSSTSGRRRTSSISARMGSVSSRVNRPSRQAS